MKLYLGILIAFALVSCNNEEKMLLPKADKTIVKEVLDHSPVYLFFRTKNGDTLVEVNRKNTIGTTNWIFNIDKRLPLRIVMPEVIKLQAKKKKGMHVNEKALNYFSYADEKNKNLAFLPFTTTEFLMEKPNYGVHILFTKEHKIIVSDFLNTKKEEVKKEDLLRYLLELPQDKPNQFLFCHDGNSTYDAFIQNEIFITEFKQQIPLRNLSNKEFVF